MKLVAVAALILAMSLVGCEIPLTLPSSADRTSTPPPTSSPVVPPSPWPRTTTPDTQTARIDPPAMVADTPQSDLLVSRTYHWTYAGKEWTWELQLPQGLYDYFKQLPRAPTSNYSVYVTHPLDDPYLGKLVSRLQDTARSESYSEFQAIEFAASLVQSLPYVTDNVSTGYDEYPRYPLETLVDNGGDCEDTSILMASLVKGMGYGVVLLRFAATSVSPGHMAVGIAGGEGIYGTYWEYTGSKYYYLETTGDGWKIGQVPDTYKTARASVLEMKPVPILTHTWESTGGAGFADLQVIVSNLGSAAAQGVYIFAGFDAGDDQVWNPQKSPLFEIGVDQKVTVTMTIQVPSGKHTRVVVQVVYGGYAVDQSYSKWFDT